MDRRKSFDSRSKGIAATPTSHLSMDPLSPSSSIHSNSNSSRRPLLPTSPLPLTCPSKLELSATSVLLTLYSQLSFCSRRIRSLPNLLRQCSHAFGRCGGVAAAATMVYSLFRSRKMLSKHPLVCLLLALPQVHLLLHQSVPHPNVIHSSFYLTADSQERLFSRIVFLSLCCSPLPSPTTTWAQVLFPSPKTNIFRMNLRTSFADIGTQSSLVLLRPCLCSCFQKQHVLHLLSMLLSGSGMFRAHSLTHKFSPTFCLD